MNALNHPRPTPSFYVEVVKPHGPIDRPEPKHVEAAGENSFGFDALLPAGRIPFYASAKSPFRDVVSAWRAMIDAEQHRDVQTQYYRSQTAAAPNGFFLRGTDGGFCRKNSGALAYTQRAWSQLVSMLLQEVPDRPRAAPGPFGWLSPQVRSFVFDELVARSARRQGPGHEILLRSFVDPTTGVRALRAVLTGRHSGIHFDDAAVANVLAQLVPADALAYVNRTIDETNGYVVLDTAGDVRATLGFRNSETGAASLTFHGGCYISALDAVIRDGREVTVNQEILERSVQIAHAASSTRRAHTLPRVGQTEDTRAVIASQRMVSDVTAATTAARSLCAKWRDALAKFVTGKPVSERTNEALAMVALDAIEERTARISAEDREALREILTNDARLRSLPFLSHAYIAGAWAVLASKSTSWEEAARLQANALQWIIN